MLEYTNTQRACDLRAWLAEKACRETALVIALVGAGALIVGGCAGPVPMRTVRDARTPVQGGSWELVLGTPEASAHAQAGWEADRNASVLAARSQDARTAADEWPQDPKPRLEYARRVYLPRHANEVIYYPDERSPGRGPGNTYPGGIWWGP